ncbi:MAG: 2-amino-4-hydroxy-6-hydroxymethyldihydropteridine diphosphokinase [Bacteroidales bacterium]|nr:2-amino-4-hydroxy-6-hydroxymethyldihydropteridine diphosphokinase [Bacteroidales bacterium]
MKRAVIGLGSNMGDRAMYLQQAKELVRSRIGQIVRTSSVIETPAWGFEADPFLNQIIVVITTLLPLQMLDELQSIERALGRTQKSSIVDGKAVYHDRTIDLDVLDYDGMHYHDERLTLPHPKIHERDFVLQSLAELDIVL